MDVPWASDEEAAVRWITDQDPAFFKRALPFIGYLEFLYEGSFYGGLRVRQFSATIHYAVSGMQMEPKDPSVAKNRQGPWRYKAP